MGKKTRYVRLDWISATDTGPPSSLGQIPIRETGIPSERGVSKSADLVTKINNILSQETSALSQSSESPPHGASNAAYSQEHAARAISPQNSPQTTTPFKSAPTAVSVQALRPLNIDSAPQTATSFSFVTTKPLPRSSPEIIPPSSRLLESLLRNTEKKLFPRNPVQTLPIPGKIYFLPGGKHFPNSIIHNQKQQDGFFRHPVLVVGTDGNIVQFYAMTKEPPRAIRDLNMALRLGATHEDQGANILRLAPESDIMLQETWLNLEQRFFIEWRNLDEWAAHVRVHSDNLFKIARRVVELEADQNRFIYKPLLRNMSVIQPGTVIMMPNAPNASTLGAPIVVIENSYPNFRFLRVKRFEDNVNFNPEARRRRCSSRAMSLAIAKFPSTGHDGTPVLFLDEDSPAMREESYVELEIFKHGRLDQCRTWCWPPVKICSASMAVLRSYIASAIARNREPVYYPPPIRYVHGTHSMMPSPGYYMNQPQVMLAYLPGGYMPNSTPDFPHYLGH